MEELENKKVLIIDDDEDVLLAAKFLLRKHSFDVTIEKNPKKIPFLLNHEQYDVILLDMNFSRDISSGKEGFMWLDKIQEIDPKAVVILITAFGDVEMAVRALKSGATDFVLKPWQNEKLLATISSGIKLKNTYKELNLAQQNNQALKKEISKPVQGIIGESQAMQSVFKMISKVASTDANVLVLGENGTGKELIARAIHEQSLRKDQIFLTVDMGAITETLFESELFGHKKGAFTDAKEDRSGRFEVADKGSLFLDEIGNLSMPLQSKLLTVLQNREVTRIGSNKAKKFDIRLICATNMPIYDMVKDNDFRQDLLYRINTVEVRLPALRERQSDIPLLINHYLESYCQKYRKPKPSISEHTMKRLQAYNWPGNIRELQHAIERSVILAEGKELTNDDFYFLSQGSNTTSTQIETNLNSFKLVDVEKDIIQKAIDKHAGNISKAAKELGLTRASLYRRLEKHGL